MLASHALSDSDQSASFTFLDPQEAMSAGVPQEILHVQTLSAQWNLPIKARIGVDALRQKL